MPSADTKPSRTRAKAAVAPAPESPVQVEPTSPDAAPLNGATLGAVEAVILSAERPVTPARIADAVFHPSRRRDDSGESDTEPKASAKELREIEHAVVALNKAYESTDRAFRIEMVSGGFRVMTLPRFADAVAAFKRARQSTRLSKPAIETLAIIAYRQPVTRAELEAIRGVACGEVLKSLVERRLVTITGRAEELGRPMLYGTTRQFLDHFGLATLKDLPAPADLARLNS